MFDAESGEELWRFETDGELHTPPVFSDEKVYFESHDGQLYAVDRQTGDERWRFNVGERADFAGVAAAPTIVDDIVYVAAPGYTLIGINAATGTERMRISHR